MPGKRPFAVFDIDGTIIRWQLYHALADELVRAGQLDANKYEQVRAARLGWKRRASESSFADYEAALVKTFDEALTSISVESLNDACHAVIKEYKDQVYRYTRDLIAVLKGKGYLLFAISASQEQIVKLLAEHYGFDDAGGSQYEIKNGRFTGQAKILKSENKPVFLKQLITKHQASWEGSVAVGDSEGDIPMLSAVQQPIAFNPTKDLFRHAQTNNWQVVVERKNMIYKLEPSDGSYLLAKTDF